MKKLGLLAAMLGLGGGVSPLNDMSSPQLASNYKTREKGQKRNARPKPSGAAQLKRISKKRKNSK